MFIGGEAGENRGRKKEFSSAQVNGFSRELFVDRLSNGNNFHNNNNRREEEEEEDDVEVELSLGLSLNGKFGVEPAKDRVKLIRSSSVSTLFILGGDEDEETHASNKVPILPAAYAPLSRTCSLPTETGEELRKRKELQSLRRMEAKRRRMDKIKFLRAGREKVDSEDYSGEENPSNGSGNSPGMVSSVNGSGMPSSQGSIGSQGSWSSGLTEFESQPIQVNRNNEVRSPSTMQYVQVQKDQKPQVSPGSAVAKATTESKEMLKNVMLEMPCVSTIGNGPNGRKIDGFLYTYRKGEEVKIVCVCHGNFMSPAEFVKHAGGAEVDNPLRHISVIPCNQPCT